MTGALSSSDKYSRADDFQGDSVPEDRSVIIVSDLHLGLEGQEEVGTDFSDLLRFLCTPGTKGEREGHPAISIDGKIRRLRMPDRIILLGDIVDMWSPRKDTYSSVLEDSFSLILSLLEFPAKIIYVAGNHDEEMAEIRGSFPQDIEPWVKICKDHYPDTAIKSNDEKQYTGLLIGNFRYFFMHGQQFDLMFKTAGLLQNYPGWVAKNYMLFRDHPGLKWGLRFLSIVLIGYLLAASFIWKITPPFEGTAYFILGLMLIIVLFTLEPTSIRAAWDFVTRRVKTKTASIETILEEGFWIPDAGKNILADVVVFGHTHVADDSKDRYRQRFHKRFINTGAWGKTKTRTGDGEESAINTFVYIDDDGPLLCYWPTSGQAPVYISRTLSGDPEKKIAAAQSSRDRFRRWRRHYFWTHA
jgi:UDP-2,3-diacylglucosamine pyrophosphatase LpxH